MEITVKDFTLALNIKISLKWKILKAAILLKMSDKEIFLSN